MMKKILVPVDFSSHTDITCRYAVEIARVFGAEIKLFNTYFDQIVIADTSFPDTLDMSTIYNEELMKEIFRHAEHHMDELEEKVVGMIGKENLGKITVSTVVTGGELEHELKGICSDFHPDLVVMGTTGKGENANTWGKVSSFIIDHAKVPVITVPEIRSFHGFETIMFAANLADDNASTINVLLDLFTPFSSRIHVVHFLSKTKQTDAYLKMKTLQMKFGKEEKADAVKFEVIESSDDNQVTVNRYVSQNHITMIALNPHKHNLFYQVFTKNITKKNLFAAKLPMISVPAAR